MLKSHILIWNYDLIYIKIWIDNLLHCEYLVKSRKIRTVQTKTLLKKLSFLCYNVKVLTLCFYNEVKYLLNNTQTCLSGIIINVVGHRFCRYSQVQRKRRKK